MSNPVCIKNVILGDKHIHFDTDKGSIDIPCDPDANAFTTLRTATAMLRSFYNKQCKTADNISFDDLNGVL